MEKRQAFQSQTEKAKNKKIGKWLIKKYLFEKVSETVHLVGVG